MLPPILQYTQFTAERLLEVYVKNFILLNIFALFSLNVSFAQYSGDFFGSCPGGVVQGNLNQQNQIEPSTSCVKITNSTDPLFPSSLRFDATACGTFDETFYISWYIMGIITTGATSPVSYFEYPYQGGIAPWQFFSFNPMNNDMIGVGGFLQCKVMETKVALDLKLFKNNVDQVNTGIHEMVPSRLACGRAATLLEKRKFLLKCTEEDPAAAGSKVAIEGCKVKINLAAGGYNGGHDFHINKTDRWGKLDVEVDSFIDIPKVGLVVYFEAPEASGESLVTFEVRDPSGKMLPEISKTTFKVKNQATLMALNIEGLTANVESHSNGNYVTASMHAKLAQAISDFRAQVFFKYGIAYETELETESASLDWGGLFDVNRDWIVTPDGHCGHRYGNQIDLSMSVFNGYNQDMRLRLRSILDDKIRHAKLYYPIEKESPIRGDHWHVQDK